MFGKRGILAEIAKKNKKPEKGEDRGSEKFLQTNEERRSIDGIADLRNKRPSLEVEEINQGRHGRSQQKEEEIGESEKLLDFGFWPIKFQLIRRSKLLIDESTEI